MLTEDIGIIGVAHTRFGKLADQDVASLVSQVTTEALDDAGIDAGEVGEVFVSQFNSGPQ